MCGRYASTAAAPDLSSLFEAQDETGGALSADYNIAPTKDVPAVVTRPDADGLIARRLRLVRWGLVPSWAKDPSIGTKLINARAESVATKPAFRRALAARRCLIPADGYYEWQRVAGERRKQPWFVHAADGGPLAFAGLYEVWRDADQNPLASCVIVTADAPAGVAHIHDRAPVMIPSGGWERWLDPAGQDPARLTDLLVPAPAGMLAAYRVGPEVGNVRNNSPELLVPSDGGGVEAPTLL